MKETDIQRTVCDYLDKKGYLFWRQNTTPIYDPVRKSFRAMPKYSIKGMADIILVIDGFVIFLEIKKPKTKTSNQTYQSKDQKLFQKRCEENGAEYHVIRRLEDLIEQGI